MKKIFLLISILFFASCNNEDDNVYKEANDFNGQKIWSKSFGGSDIEEIHGTIATQDGGFIVIGSTKSNDGDITDKKYALEDIWLSKYDADGNLLWSKTYGGSEDDLGYSVIENTDGTLVVAGYSKSSDGEVPSNLGMHDFFIFKTDSQGNLIWAKSHGFMSHDHAHKIINTSDGGYFVVGYVDYAGIGKNNNSKGVLHGVGEFYGQKLDANGNKLWDKYFGGTQNDRVFDVVEANDGGFVMVGYSESSDFDANDNHGSYDYWAVKVNSVGELVWKKSYGGSELDQAYGIVKNINNTYLITGTSNSLDGDISSNKGANDVWIISIDDYGRLLWNKSFGGTGFDTSNSIRMISNGNFLISGHTRSVDGDITENKGENDFWAFTISPNGKMLWQKTFGGTNFDFGYDAIELKDKGYVIVGQTQSNNLDIPQNKGFSDLLIIKVH
ncbi:hypothetical protein [uncultured Flavobacterium sp.]|uniref:hypothetical protein n=1 Tax=uncultured Flavobacterium sp. TaxID=165435 RepID=UPI0030EDE54A|tara:strand:- start:26991 stop:28316 length:1326 start_codon:yes stop_codon:yes gene_type:complete